jgi:hypothetical protein
MAAGEHGDAARSGWRARLLTLEAMVALSFARLLIQFVRFRRWRHLLGVTSRKPVSTTDVEASRQDHYLARVVERAAQHLPFETKCLPRAMALFWMLSRRNRDSQLVLAVLPEERRGGSLDDLHAWVEMDRTILIGDTGLKYIEITRFYRKRITN